MEVAPFGTATNLPRIFLLGDFFSSCPQITRMPVTGQMIWTTDGEIISDPRGKAKYLPSNSIKTDLERNPYEAQLTMPSPSINIATQITLCHRTLPVNYK